MKVQSSNPTKITQAAKPTKSSNADLQAMVREKFGKAAEMKKLKPKPVATDVELISKKGVSSSDEEGFGDISNNAPDAVVTQEKLKHLLKTGGFQFSERERSALGQILK